ncbi:serine hydrolase domain-containing protein [Nonomuraea sp. NPDC050556]|uniref:serine hydrolase domain-containing protein n=1 Tax=Nonomuraea sp. NPDC050556 TaxID=3364369 RepID=UPI0037B97255
MRRILLVLALVAGCGGYQADDLRAGLRAIRDAGAVGAQAMVIVDGRVTSATSGPAVPGNGHFRIGSDTKTFVATVILQLLAEGRLALADPVEKHLPGLVGGGITLLDLLRHTSGLYDYSVAPEWDPFASRETFERRRYQHYTAEELVAVAMRHAPFSAPGVTHKYSNTNYVLLGMVIAKLTGRRWQDEVRRRIIEPLALTGTSVGDGPALPEPHARGYTRFSLDGPLVDTTLLDPSAGDAGGAIISTPRDLLRFFGALLGGELLRPFALDLMKRTVPAEEGRYGLGLAWSDLPCGDGYWRHGGAVPGYLTYEGFVADGRRGIVLSVSSMSLDGVTGQKQDAASQDLVNKVLCAIR